MRAAYDPGWRRPALLLAVLVAVPLLRTAPGRVAADGTTAVVLDPGPAVARAGALWNPSAGLGGVPADRLETLWPAAPFHWLLDILRVPDWVAQRLWLTVLVVGAGWGVLFLGRVWRWATVPSAAAAFAYALSPFAVTVATERSLLLLPFATLPWLLAVTVLALHSTGWRHPAIFGLLLAASAPANVPAAVLVLGVISAWFVYSVVVSRRISRTRAVSTAVKLAAAVVAVNVWWVIGLSVLVTNGLGGVADDADVVARTSSASEIVRGLGTPGAYESGADPVGAPYAERPALLALTFGLPALAVFGLGAVRWRHRSFVIGLFAAGMVLASGTFPRDDPSLLGRFLSLLRVPDLASATEHVAAALPLVALALALGLGTLAAAVAEERPRVGLAIGAAIAVFVFAAAPPLWRGDLVPAGESHDDVPEHWLAAAAHLDGDARSTRILELPGTDRWRHDFGTTSVPVLAALTERSHAARSSQPAGTAAGADLLAAIDDRIQALTLEPEALAPLARLLGAGSIVVRGDAPRADDHTLRPRTLHHLVASAPDVVADRGFGPPEDGSGPRDETWYVHEADRDAVPVLSVFEVAHPRGVLSTTSVGRVVLLAGDGSGVVDAAAAGLFRGDEVIRYSGTISDDLTFPRHALTGTQGLVVTDTNRRRAQRWSTVRYTTGFTEQLDGGVLDHDPADERLDLLPDRPSTATLAEHGPITVRGSDYGGDDTYEPHLRPVLAADGDASTAWRVATEDPRGERLVLGAAQPLTTSYVDLLQADGALTIERLRLRFDTGDTIDVDLDARSLVAPGQRVDVGRQNFRSLEIEILDVDLEPRLGPTAESDVPSVGLAEVGIGAATDEVLRMPTDLLDAGGFRTLGLPLAVVMTRQRADATEVTRDDEERRIQRVLELPTRRSFAVTGTARLSSAAPSQVIDRLLGRNGPSAGEADVTARSTMPGGLGLLPANVLDGDPTTRWTSALGGEPALRVDLPAPLDISRLDLLLLDDGHHAVPDGVRVTIDDVTTATIPLTTRRADGDLRRAAIRLPQSTVGSRVEVTFTFDDPADANRSPVSVAELGLPGASVSSYLLGFDTGCRDDLVELDGRPVPVRVHGTIAAARAGDALAIDGCGAVTLDGTEHRLETAPGATTGLDLDRLVLRSDPGGGPGQTSGPLVAATDEHPEPAAPVVSIDTQNQTTIDATVSGATPGEPFWLVLAEGHDDGWALDSEQADADGPHLVNGFANGFLVTPTQADFVVQLRFLPQNRVEVGLLVSLLGVIAAIALLMLPTRLIEPLPIPRQEPLRRLRAFTWEGALPRRRDAQVLGAVAGLVAVLVVGVPLGVALGVVAGVAARRESWRWLFTSLPALLVAGVGVYVLGLQFRNELPPGMTWPEETGAGHRLALLAALLLAVDVAIDRLWARRSEFR